MTDFWTWWQHLPQHISPVIFQIGSFKLQYYGLMYLVAFGITYGLVLYRLRHEPRFAVSREQVNDLTTLIILGLMVG
ncbi:MAG: prolipoprotein diacylglyceryl transferase, partial [Desulfobacterales bacterium]|nr:prolipoprotein diacylglyceryl transferase [Desulfobacterales bacterium]